MAKLKRFTQNKFDKGETFFYANCNVHNNALVINLLTALVVMVLVFLRVKLGDHDLY